MPKTHHRSFPSSPLSFSQPNRLLTMSWPWSRSFRSHPDWNGQSSHPSTRHSMNGPDLYSDRRNMSARERGDAQHRAHGRVHGTNVTPRERSNLNAARDNAYGANQTDRRNRDYTEPHSRTRRSSRRVYFHDELPAAPEPPRPTRLNSSYGRYADPARADQRNSHWEDNYHDAYQWIHGDRPRRGPIPHSTLPVRNAANSRHYFRYEAPELRFGTSTSRRIDPSDSRAYRWRSAFSNAFSR